MLLIKVKQSIVEFETSTFDLVTDMRRVWVEFVKKLYSLYGQEYTHLVKNGTCSEALPGYIIKITYPAKLKCMLSKLLEEVEKIVVKVLKTSNQKATFQIGFG